MKHKLSVTMDEEVILRVLDKLRTGQYRNKSHVVECALKKYLEDEENNIQRGNQNAN